MASARFQKDSLAKTASFWGYGPKTHLASRALQHRTVDAAPSDTLLKGVFLEPDTNILASLASMHVGPEGAGVEKRK